VSRRAAGVALRVAWVAAALVLVGLVVLLVLALFVVEAP